MKKIWALFIAISFTSLLVSQTDFGIKGGLNLATFGRDIEDNEFRNSFHIGAFMQIELFEDFSIQPEIIYSEQGTILTDTRNDVKVKLNYLNIPLVAKYYLDYGWYLEAGPYVSFALARKEESLGDLQDASDIYNSVETGITFGLMREYDRWFISLRINGSINNVLKENKENEDRFVNSSVYLISIGYKL